MIRTTYEAVTRTGYKRGPCAVCGKTAERQKTFSRTLNPFNRNADGSVKTRQEIWRELGAEAGEWQDQPVRHVRCEAA